MAIVLGLNCALYQNTGSYGTPTWSVISGVQNLTLSMDKAEANVSTRASSWEQIAATLKKVSVEFNMPWDVSDSRQQAILDNFTASAGASLEFLILAGTTSDVGAEGIRASFDIIKFNRTEDLEGAAMVEIAMKPAKSSNAPAWYTQS